MYHNLQGKRLLLRIFEASDAPVLAQLANNKKIWDNVRDAFPHPYRLEDAQNFIAAARELNPQRHFAIVMENQMRGAIGIHPRAEQNKKHVAEIGFWLGEAHWGQGIISEAIPLICHYGFQELHLKKIVAEVYEHNKASKRALEKAGFKQEAIFRKEAVKNERVIDVYRMVIFSTQV